MFKKNKLIIGLIVTGITISTGSYYVFSEKEEVVNADIGNPVEVEKASIQDKMVNSIDYFKTAKGSFHYYAKLANINDTIEFEVQLKDKPSSFYNTKSPEGQKESVTVFDGEQILNANSTKKEYVLTPVVKDEGPRANQASPAKQRYKIDGNGTKKTILRKDPSNMGLASSVLFNQNIALGFLKDYSQWKVESNEEYLGLKAKVITGKVPESYAKRHGGETFKMWVHKDTGILLNFEEYDQKGEKVFNITVNDIKLNEPTDKQKFKIQEPAGYKRIEIK